MIRSLDVRAFIAHRGQLARLGATLHRTHPLDGPEKLFIVCEGEVAEVTADALATVAARLQARKGSAISKAYGHNNGGSTNGTTA